MINQVIGRVGRGHRKTSVTIQTYDPDSPIIKYAVEKDYKHFYDAELKERKLFHFPPFCYILKLTCVRKSQKVAIKASENLVEMLKSQPVEVEIVGPAPSFIEKKNDTFNWQIVIKATKRSDLTTIIKLLPANWTYDIDPTHLL
jgi:primosomal protein N' (replication factor Y)